MKKTFAFNIWDINSATALIDIANIYNSPIILQTSESIFTKIGSRAFSSYIHSYAKDMKVDVLLHLDHCKHIEIIADAIHNDWDAVMFDGSSLPLERNIEMTQKVCSLAHDAGVLVEGEVGSIAGTEDDVSLSDNGLAEIEAVKRYVQSVHIDWLAAAFGNVHGFYHGTPTLHFELLDKIADYTNLPFVVHGGSGLSDTILKKLLKYPNVKKINISTEMKQAYLYGIQKAACSCIDYSKPLNLQNVIFDEIRNMAASKIRLLVD